MLKTEEMGRAMQRKPLINLLILPFQISQMFLTLPTTLITPTGQMFPKRLITRTIPTRLMIPTLLTPPR